MSDEGDLPTSVYCMLVRSHLEYAIEANCKVLQKGHTLPRKSGPNRPGSNYSGFPESFDL